MRRFTRGFHQVTYGRDLQFRLYAYLLASQGRLAVRAIMMKEAGRRFTNIMEQAIQHSTFIISLNEGGRRRIDNCALIGAPGAGKRHPGGTPWSSSSAWISPVERRPATR